MTPNLPSDAHDAWGFEGDRLVYLVRVEKQDDTNICHVCGDEIKFKKDELDEAREKHLLTHRLWRFADTHERYLDGYWKQHRFCLCPVNQAVATWTLSYEERVKIKPSPLWHRECGGYIRILP